MTELSLYRRYPDTGNATIAGYGRFKRPPCEVGAQGPHKFEFCGVEEKCVKGTQVPGSEQISYLI